MPKGVMVEHRSVCNLVTGFGRRYALSTDDRVLQFASVAFDVSVEEIFGTLTSGATLVLRTDAWLDRPAEFWSLCHRYGITLADLPTQFWHQLMLDRDAQIPDCLGHLIIGGEAVGAQALAAWFARPGHRPSLTNAYGPTETTVNSTLHLVQAQQEQRESIGRPIDNARLYILDDHRQPVPIGVAGEIWIGGEGVARGYLNRPDLTAAAFHPDPFAPAAGAAKPRMYRSGDAGRWLSDGRIEYLGRTDAQVKLRGFRIELGDIEARLREHAQVTDAVVVLREDRPGDKRLVACYVAVSQVEAEQLRQHLSRCLPNHMVPSAFVRLEHLPLNGNGKVDRARLASLAVEKPRQHAFVPPRGELEQRIAAVWAQVLDVDQVGRRDDFFQLGGHSLLAVRTIDALHRAGVAASIERLFRQPTLKAFADSIGQDQVAPNEESLVRLRAGSASEHPLFLVHDGDGCLLWAHALACHLGTEFPLYGLPALPTMAEPLCSVESMARRLVDLLRQVQAYGPYRLAGYCMGGVLAYEIAQQLAAGGEQVEFLGLLDTDLPPHAPRPGSLPGINDSLLAYVRQAAPAGFDTATFSQLAAVRSASLATLIERCTALGALPAEFEGLAPDEIERTFVRINAFDQAFGGSYIAHPPASRVVLFTATEEGGDPRRGWDAVVPLGALHLVPVAGTHHSMLRKPHLARFADTFARSMKDEAALSVAPPGTGGSPSP